MTSFYQKKLAPDKTLPEILKGERRVNNFSLEEVSFKSQISLKYLSALEEGIYEKLPGNVYVKQFIKKLAKLYSLNEKILLNIFQKEKASQLTFKIMAPAKEALPRKILNLLSLKLLGKVGLALVIIIFLTYLGWEIINIFTPPFLEVKSPPSQTITSSSDLEIIGQTEPEVNLRINNQEILPDQNGAFKQTVGLSYGLNSFTVSAKKEHSPEKQITISILRQ